MEFVTFLETASILSLESFLYTGFSMPPNMFWGSRPKGLSEDLGSGLFSLQGVGCACVCVRACVRGLCSFARRRSVSWSSSLPPPHTWKTSAQVPGVVCYPPSSEGCREYHCIALAGGWMSCWEAACLHPGGSARA